MSDDDPTIVEVPAAGLPTRTARFQDLSRRAEAVLTASDSLRPMPADLDAAGWRIASAAADGCAVMQNPPGGEGPHVQTCPWPEFDAHLDRFEAAVSEAERLATGYGLTSHHTGREST